MFIPLIFSTTVLIGLHYYGYAEIVYQWMVKQPLQYYIWFLLFVSVVQLLIWVYRKVFPHIVGFYRSMSRITSRIDNLSNTIDRNSEKNSSSPFKGGQKRSFSSKSYSSSFNHPSLGRGNTKESKESRMLSSRRIKGLFASIVENEAMVSLEREFQNVGEKFLTRDDLNSFLKKNYHQDTEFRVREHRSKIDGSSFLTLHVLQRGSLSDLITGFGWRVISAVFPYKVKFASRIKLLYLFSGYLYQMYRHHGSTQVVKYLKASQLAIQKAIAGDKVDNLRILDKDIVRSRVTSSGLPVFIPSRDRKLIIAEQLNPAIIRFYLTLYSIYRVISIPGTLKLQTIVDPFSPGKDFIKVEKLFLDILSQSRFSSMFNKSILGREQSPLLLEAASSTHKVSWFGLFSDPAVLDFLKLGAYARNLMNIMGQYRLRLLFDSCSSLFPANRDDLLSGLPDSVYSHSIINNPEGQFGGKLSIKEEAAGKMRVFAMVDVWTQSILKPIEQMLARFLKDLPNDGVYDQHASELRARSKSQISGCSYGYDLSAATDRLPISIQEKLLNIIVPDLGDNWGSFLTKRDYYLYLPDSFARELASTPKTIRAKAPNSFDVGGQELPIFYNEKSKPWTKLRYTTGQPMGALSSFAMLAVTHHMIAQLSYRLAYNLPLNIPFTRDTWYTGYECTGDDIIIFDKEVAHQYLYIMEALGVPVNTMKSVVSTSKPVTEYLKCTSKQGQSVGSISWKMFMSTGNTMMGRANIINSILSKGIIHDNINKYIANVARQSLYNPGNLNPTLIALWTIMSNQGLISVDECLKALINGKKAVFHFAKTILYNADIVKITGLLPRIYKKLPFTIETSKQARHVWNFEAPWFRITLWKPLAVFQYRTDVSADSLKLSQAIFDLLISHNFDISEISNPVLIDGPNEFNPNLKDLDETQIRLNDYKVLFQSLLQVITEKLEKIAEPLLSDPAQMDSDTAFIYNQRQEMDRYNELLDLVNRALIKIDPDSDTPPPRVIKPSDLKLVSLLRRMGDRPLFTTANSMSARVNFPYKFT
nr:MAG: RNA-dependent RNA polymerase [Rhizoctonia solani mitovirus 49]